MPRYIPFDYDQSRLVAIHYRDQLQPGTFEFAIHYLIEEVLDLSIFDDCYQNDEAGRPAYHPAILLKIILFGYAKGITSSRQLQWQCESNIIFKALSCDSAPHFTTIASFISSYPEKIESLFEQILLTCYQQGLLGNELFALDGCKLPSNAAKEWSGTLKELDEKRIKIKKLIKHHMASHQRADQQVKSGKNSEVESTTKTIKTLENAYNKISDFLATATPREGQGKRKQEVKSNITDNQSAKMKTSKGTIQGYNGIAVADQQHQVIVEAKAFGEGQEHHTLQPLLIQLQTRFSRIGISKNIYNEGVKVVADTGYANEANMAYLYEQGIDGYIPDNQFRSRDPKFGGQKQKYGKRHQEDAPHAKSVTSATNFTVDLKKKTCRCPQGKQMRLSHEGLDQANNWKLHFTAKVSDCRQCHEKEKCLRNPNRIYRAKAAGRQVSFIVEARTKPKKYTEWMKERVDSEEGKAIYSQRMAVIEPVFGNIASTKKLNRLSLRGRIKVNLQWQLYCMVHNIEKLKNYGNLGEVTI